MKKKKDFKKRNKKVKQGGDDMTIKDLKQAIKPETIYQIVKESDGSYKWIKAKRGK